MKRRALLWPALTVAAAAACARLPSLPLLAPAGGETTAALEYYERLAGMSVEQQSVEHAAAAGAFDVHPSEGNRLRVALALSVPPWRDDARIVALLAGFEQSRKEETAPVRPLALLVRKAAAERLRLREEARQDQRRREGLLRDEQRRNEDLQQKLEALRAIDRDMRRNAPRR